MSTLTTGRVKYQLAELATVPRAAVVVEDRYSSVFRLEHVRPSVVADGLAECLVGWPTVPILFRETRKLAQEWTYRFLGAAAAAAGQEYAAELTISELAPAVPIAPAPPTAAEVRAWALANGHQVNERGRVAQHLRAAYLVDREQ